MGTASCGACRLLKASVAPVLETSARLASRGGCGSRERGIGCQSEAIPEDVVSSASLGTRCSSMDVSGTLWTILLPGTKNKATIEVFAEHLGEEIVRETTTYAPSASLVSRSKFKKPKLRFGLFLFCCRQALEQLKHHKSKPIVPPRSDVGPPYTLKASPSSRISTLHCSDAWNAAPTNAVPPYRLNTPATYRARSKENQARFAQPRSGCCQYQAFRLISHFAHGYIPQICRFDAVGQLLESVSRHQAPLNPSTNPL